MAQSECVVLGRAVFNASFCNISKQFETSARRRARGSSGSVESQLTVDDDAVAGGEATVRWRAVCNAV